MKKQIHYINQSHDFIISENYFLYFKEGHLYCEGTIQEASQKLASFMMDEEQIGFILDGQPVVLHRVKEKKTCNEKLTDLQGHYENMLFALTADIIDNTLTLTYQGNTFKGEVDLIEENQQCFLINHNCLADGTPLDMIGFERLHVEPDKLIYFPDEEHPQAGRITLKKSN